MSSVLHNAQKFKGEHPYLEIKGPASLPSTYMVAFLINPHLTFGNLSIPTSSILSVIII